MKDNLFTNIDLVDVIEAAKSKNIDLSREDAEKIANIFAEQKRSVNPDSVRRMAGEINPRYKWQQGAIDTVAKEIPPNQKALRNLASKGSLFKNILKSLPVAAATPSDMDYDPLMEDPRLIEDRDRILEMESNNKKRLEESLKNRRGMD